MKLEQSFTVAAPPDTVWAALIDVERVAPCLPGAEIAGLDDEGAYQGSFTVRLGPTTASYRGTLRMQEVDEDARRATMHARGTDKRGQGGANATIVSTVRPDGDGTAVDVATDFTITGRLARFGRGGMIEDISRRLLRDFATCLQERLAEPAPPTQPAPEPDPAATTPLPPPEAGAPPPPPPPAPRAAPPQPPPKAQPVSGLRLLLGVLRDRLARLLGRRPPT